MARPPGGIVDLKTCMVLSELNMANDKNWFYGAQGKKSRKEEQVVSGNLKDGKQLKRSIFEDSLGCFTVYKGQNDALGKCEQEGPKSRIFAFEYSINHPGQRRYLVTTVERFWRWYKEQDNVSFYELIPCNRPSRLYFDLEFYREANPKINENDLIKDFNECLLETLKDMFDISLNVEKDLLVLDASTAVKFSEHIVVHLPNNYLFPSNIAMKPFIQLLEKKMLSSNRCLVWNLNLTKLVTLFDANRNFRLYLSSKLGKKNPLVLAKRCQFYAHTKCSSKQVFLDSLIVPAELSGFESVFRILADENGEFNYGHSVTSKIPAMSMKVQEANKYVDYMTGYGASSPFPVLDQHIIYINKRWKSNASIRQWKLSIDKSMKSRRITYYISHCRYCFNIAREHRSNGVFWVVDLNKLHCFQKCFDIDCRGMSSNYFPLPNFVSSCIPSTEDLARTTDGDEAQNVSETDGETIGNILSEETIFKLVNDVKAINEVEVRKGLQRLRRRSAVIEMKALKNCESSTELTDDELLRAFIEIDS